MWTVTGSEVEASLDNPVDLILYGDKGQSQPVVIGGAENFIFTQGQVDEFQVCKHCNVCINVRKHKKIHDICSGNGLAICIKILLIQHETIISQTAHSVLTKIR